MSADEVMPGVVRDALSSRQPMEAPAKLRTRVLAIPDSDGQREVRGRFRRQILSVAGTAVVGLFVLIGGYALLMGLQITGGSGSPIPTPTPEFDPSIDGPGIVRGEVDMLLGLGPFLIAGGISAFLIVMAFRRDIRREKYAAVVACAVILAGASLVSNQPGPTFGDSWGPAEGIKVQDAPVGSSNKDSYYVTVGPGENFSVNFNVRNDGLLPVRIGGVQDRSDEGGWAPRWTSLGVGFDPHYIGFIDEMTSFSPVNLAPGDNVDLYLTGRAGRCAAGTAGRTDSAYTNLEIRLVYSVLGFSWTNVPDLPFEVLQADREGCL